MPRAGIREERLRATAGLREEPALTSWRGRSGRRYVVGIHAPTEPDIAEVTEAVVLAVARGADGSASLVDVSETEPGAHRPVRESWLDRARARGATEIHVHRLARTADERRAVLDDLVLRAG